MNSGKDIVDATQELVDKVKEEYHLRPIDRINKTMDAIDMVSTIISTLNS